MTIESVSTDEDGLYDLTVKADGRNASIVTRHLFPFTGADPNTQWLRDREVEVDDRGFVLTEAAESSNSSDPSRCLAFQTNVAGIFAIWVRHENTCDLRVLSPRTLGARGKRRMM
jgi:thioredoxin reductase (NADPH)